MSRRRISGSIFWGLVFATFGSVLLAGSFGYSIPLWSGIVRYWPVLLIVWGLFKFVDYLALDNRENGRPLFSGGDVFAIVFVILFGSLLTFAVNLNPNFDVWDLTGNNFSFEEDHEVAANSGSTIAVSNRYGDVAVFSSDVEKITVHVRKTIRASSRAEAERLASRLGYSISKDGSKYRIGAEFNRRLKASLVIHVPVRSMIAVENRNGDVSIRLQERPVHDVSVFNEYGSVSLEIPSGSAFRADVQNWHGEILSDFTELQSTREQSESSLKGQAGPAGPTIHIESRNGEIQLRKGG